MLHKIIRYNFYLVIVIINFSISTHAQNRAFKNIGVNDGLPSATVYDIIQDSRGFLWIGTDNGLAIYDGSKCETYTIKNGIVGNIVRKIFEDKNGNVWIGTNGGLSIYDGYHFTNLTKKNG